MALKNMEIYGPALSMMGVYHKTKGTPRQKREAVRKAHKKVLSSVKAKKR